MTPPFRGLIIGAGSIGGLIDSPSSASVASHAHAYALHPNVSIGAICEPNDANAAAFMERWGECIRYRNLDEIGDDEHFDIVSLASPTQYHAHDLKILLDRRDCPYILCEKPLVATANEFERVRPRLETTDKKVLIHLMRRYNHAFIDMAHRLQQGEFGITYGFSGVCTKGLLHNGSHLLEVLGHFLGGVVSIDTIRPIRNGDDLCGEFAVACKRASGTVTVLQDPGYSVFELTLWLGKGMIKIVEGGARIEWFAKTPSEAYEGYYELVASESIPTNLSRYALDSLRFLLETDRESCRAILREHLELHRIIFNTLERGISV